MITHKTGLFWRVLNVLVIIVTFGRNRTFLTNYVTTIGPWIAFPIGWNPADFPDILAHEEHHVERQFKRLGLGSAIVGIIPAGIAYLCLPLPIGLAWCRWAMERSAYVAGWAVELAGLEGDVRAARRAQLIDHGVRMMTTGAYGWAWPFPRAVRRWFEEHTS